MKRNVKMMVVATLVLGVSVAFADKLASLLRYFAGRSSRGNSLPALLRPDKADKQRVCCPS